MIKGIQERSYSMSSVRQLRQSNLAPYGIPEIPAFWFQWNHPAEQQESLSSILRHFIVDSNWGYFIRPNDVCIDIGGYTGDTAIPMAVLAYDRHRRKPGRVLVVEPNPGAFEVLQCALALNHSLGRFTALQRAITKEDCVEVSILDHGNMNCNGGIIDETYSRELIETLNSRAQNEIRVTGTTLETLCRSSLTDDEVSRISFIKTDCEGYDKEILISSAAFLDKIRPTIFVEWFAWFTQEDSQSLFEIISQIDYVPFNPISLEAATVDQKISDLLLVHKSKLVDYDWFS